METAPCEVLPWDSEFFGCRVGRVHGGRLDRERLAAIEEWCRAEAIDCLYFLADADDPATASLAEGAGFLFVDVRVTLGRSLAGFDPPEASPVIRPAREDDVLELRSIARVSHTDSRFYADPHFGRDLCDDLYATWIEKSCAEDTVLVAEHQGRPAGYVTCKVDGGIGQIGLLAVAAAARGLGLGGALMRSALSWFAGQGASRVRVVTQGRNQQAQRLYEKHGLRTESIGLWFHHWPREAERA